MFKKLRDETNLPPRFSPRVNWTRPETYACFVLHFWTKTWREKCSVQIRKMFVNSSPKKCSKTWNISRTVQKIFILKNLSKQIFTLAHTVWVILGLNGSNWTTRTSLVQPFPKPRFETYRFFFALYSKTSDLHTFLISFFIVSL